MKQTLSLMAAVVIGLCAFSPGTARGEDEASQALKGSATGFELKMRILEGSRDKPAQPAKPVTSSYLKYVNLVNFDLEEDLQAEQQIKKLYNLKDVSLIATAGLAWEKGKSEKAIYMFRINGREYLLMVAPGRQIEKNQFRIEVFEQAQELRTSLLDTEFSLPDKGAAVFGFEDTALKPYFISLRVAGWSGVLGGAWSGGAPLYPGEEPKPGQKVMPPKLVKQVDPIYPEIARNARVEGAVILEATTDTYGRIASVKVLRSIPLLDQAAVDALRQWIYEPIIINGKPQSVTFTVTMQFKLDEKEKPKVGGVVGGVFGGVQGGVSTGVGGGVAAGVEGGVKGGVSGGIEGGVVGGVLGGVAGGQDKQFEGDAIRAVGNVKTPKLVKQVNPVYPEAARKGHVEGTVILEAKTDEQGNVVDARILRSIPVLDQAAIDAVKQWKYEPLIIDGKPRKVIFTVTVRFMLKEGDKAKTLDKFAQGAVKVEGDMKPPKLVKEVRPVYPEVARLAEVQGVVILSVKADEKGQVVDVMVLRSIPLLDQAAIDAVRQWVYEPTIIDGKAAPIVFTVTVRFQLQ
jgi:TonB family protein